MAKNRSILEGRLNRKKFLGIFRFSKVVILEPLGAQIRPPGSENIPCEGAPNPPPRAPPPTAVEPAAWPVSSRACVGGYLLRDSKHRRGGARPATSGFSAGKPICVQRYQQVFDYDGGTNGPPHPNRCARLFGKILRWKIIVRICD